MRIDAILFDLDGTLLDTTDLIIKSFQHTCSLHLQRDVTVDDVYPYFGKPLRTALGALGPDCVEDLIKTYRAYNLEHHDGMISIFPGVTDTIKALAEYGIKMAIVTSKTEKTALRGLRLFALESYFNEIIGLESTDKHKPDPAPVQLALERLQIEAEYALMVGDSPFDLQSAKAAGVKTAAVRWSALPWADMEAESPDVILEKTEDLLTIVKKNG
jgi:pyrophosphatase PpaX